SAASGSATARSARGRSTRGAVRSGTTVSAVMLIGSPLASLVLPGHAATAPALAPRRTVAPRGTPLPLPEAPRPAHGCSASLLREVGLNDRTCCLLRSIQASLRRPAVSSVGRCATSRPPADLRYIEHAIAGVA